jgi:hypothetical protein
MEQSFNNVALFIKRAEEYHTKEFITDAFNSKNIGKIKDVTFIKKQNNVGKSYNGVIVVFEHWNNNKNVEKLLQDMTNSSDGTTKFYFNPHRFWHIKVHQQRLSDAHETIIVDTSLPDKERIEKLEELVRSMSTQIHFTQTKIERSEKLFMSLELKETQHHLNNMELRSQLEWKDMEIGWNKADFEEKINILRDENNTLRETLNCRQMLNAAELTRKEYECEMLRQELRDCKCVSNYIENQNKELIKMLKFVSKESLLKEQVDKYIVDNFQ